ncbi:MAG TPA: redoxin domain-containing protein [Ktedonobacterales bacterium]|nr:redoxin domain-containing protein [Ktedonobacterales bacterium]
MSQHQDVLDGRIAPLPVGACAPDFRLPQVSQEPYGSVVGLHRAGPCVLVLVFYPMDWEPVSREQLTLYQAYTDIFDQLGARLHAISIDHLHCHEAFAHDAHLRFPLLADFQPRGWVARQFGVFRETQGVSARALFVLDRRRVIRFSKAYPDALNPGVDELLTTLEALVSGAAGHTGRPFGA